MRYILLFFVSFFHFKLLAYDLSKMSVEEKVGQMFMVYFDGEDANENALRLIKDAKIGGIILYNQTNKLESPEQVRNLNSELQLIASDLIGIPLFIALDQEGGTIARLKKGFTEFPDNAALGMSKNPKLAYKSAQYIGKEIKSVGVNFNLAPVVDVNNNPKNPIIGVRSFGDDPKLVTQFGKKSIEGYESIGVIPCLKHFPGHGDTTLDSHNDLPLVPKSLSQLLKTELYPYVNLAPKAQAIMTAHILFPQIDPDNCATLSSKILKGILRERLNFNGVLITDSLTMRGVLKGHENLKEVVFKAIKAGNDILLIGNRDPKNRVDGKVHVDEIIKIYKSVVSAVKADVISEDRIDESVKRILALKEKADLKRTSRFLPELQKTLKTKKHLDLSREIAKRAILIKDWQLDEDLSSKKILLIAPKDFQDKIEGSELNSLGKTTSSCFFSEAELKDKEYQEILEELQSTDVVVFYSYNAWKKQKQADLLNQVSAIKPTICIAIRDPYDLDISNKAVVKIATFSFSKNSFQVVSELIKENMKK